MRPDTLRPSQQMLVFSVDGPEMLSCWKTVSSSSQRGEQSLNILTLLWCLELIFHYDYINSAIVENASRPYDEVLTFAVCLYLVKSSSWRGRRVLQILRSMVLSKLAICLYGHSPLIYPPRVKIVAPLERIEGNVVCQLGMPCYDASVDLREPKTR
jgi:hypothetical protein